MCHLPDDINVLQGSGFRRFTLESPLSEHAEQLKQLKNNPFLCAEKLGKSVQTGSAEGLPRVLNLQQQCKGTTGANASDNIL